MRGGGINPFNFSFKQGKEKSVIVFGGGIIFTGAISLGRLNISSVVSEIFRYRQNIFNSLCDKLNIISF